MTTASKITLTRIALVPVFAVTAAVGGLASCDDRRGAESTSFREPSTDSRSEIVVKHYSVPEGYMYLLAEAAFGGAGDTEFQPPKSTGSTIWEPWPADSLRALGLEFRDGSMVMYIETEGRVLFRADEQGQREFCDLHRRIGLKIGPGIKASEGVETTQETTAQEGEHNVDPNPFTE